MTKGKSAVMLIILLLAGIIIGGLISELTKEVSWLSWLSFGHEVGFGADSPAVLDLGILRLSFGFALRLDVAVIIGLIAAAIIYRKFFR